MKHAIHIRTMRTTDIPSVSRLHMRVLPTTIARIGNPYLSNLYAKLLEDASSHLALVARIDDQIIGVITATKDLYITQRALQRMLFYPTTIIAVIRAVLRHRVKVAELIERMSTERQIRIRFPGSYPTILTFFVDTAHQHKGIGKNSWLVQKHLPKNTKLYVDTEMTNTHAQQWYSAHGFKKSTPSDQTSYTGTKTQTDASWSLCTQNKSAMAVMMLMPAAR